MLELTTWTTSFLLLKIGVMMPILCVKESRKILIFTCDDTLIKEHMKFIEEQGLFKEGQLILAMLLKYHVSKH